MGEQSGQGDPDSQLPKTTDPSRVKATRKDREIETEVKLAFHSQDLDKLTSFFGADNSKAARRRLSTVYFDTADAALRDKGLALRVRRDGQRYIQTIKGEDRGGGGALSRREIEAPITSPNPDLSAIDDPDIADVVRQTSLAGLKPVFRVDVERISFAGPDSGPDVAVDIDIGEVKAGRRRAAICEVELESKGASLRALYDLALRLHRAVPVRISKVSKSDTGYLLRSGNQPSPSTGGKPKLNPDISAEEALRQIIQSCLDQMIANEPCVARTKDPEGIHQMRVALRRMRSILRLFRNLLPPGHYGEIVAELRWLTNALGPARDWDVFCTEILDPVHAYLPDHDGLATLRRRTKARRNRARQTAQEAVASPRFTELVLRLSQWLADSAWRDQPLSEQSARLFAPARLFAAEALTRRFKAVRKLGKRIDTLPVPERHQLRIEVKKLRYAVDFFGALFNARSVKAFARRLASLQDDLGYLNDVAVAAHLAGQVAADARAPDREPLRAAEGLLIGWHGHGVAIHEADLIRDVKRLLKAELFWDSRGR